jgi:multidrug resistance efflux pump
VFQDALAAARKKHADELSRIEKLLEKETQSRQALEAALAAVRQSVEQKSASQAESNEQLSVLRKALVKEQDARATAEAKLAESKEGAEELKTDVDIWLNTS